MKNIEDISKELEAREPLFHLPVSREELERQVDVNFWEVGASGNVYDRDRVINGVAERFEKGTEPDTSNWVKTYFQCKELGPDTYMVTYQLDQEGRLTRRLTIYRLSDGDWKLLYHQGTIIQSEN